VPLEQYNAEITSPKKMAEKVTASLSRCKRAK
jgi:hypothetical protein